MRTMGSCSVFALLCSLILHLSLFKNGVEGDLISLELLLRLWIMMKSVMVTDIPKELYVFPRLFTLICEPMHAYVTHRLNAPKFILADFNHCTLNKTWQVYEQHVSCATTQKKTTDDLCYGSVDRAYKPLPMPSQGASYHNSIYLMPGNKVKVQVIWECFFLPVMF